jgi:hypothetical protein
MTRFDALLFLLLAPLLVYTALVVQSHGLGLLPLFFEAIAEQSWQGQFNFDFLTFLVLSATWSAWRFGYGVKGWALAVLAFFGGMPYLATTLFLLRRRHGADWAAILLPPKGA